MEGQLSSKRIMILTLSVGAGHVSAARAVAAEFSARRPEADVRIVDALENARALFSLFYFQTYLLLIRFAPAVWGRFFRSRVERLSTNTAPSWAWRWGCRLVFDEISKFNPDALICCEVGASEIASIARRDGLTNAVIVNVITDIEGEPVWVSPDVSTYVVPAESTKAELKAWGAPLGAIEVCGIPIDKRFAQVWDKSETRRTFGLDDRPIVLLMGGGIGPTRMDVVAARLLSAGIAIQVLALPGRDAKIRRALRRLKHGSHASLLVLEWTDQVAALMQAAELLVTKPGGVTLAEAAACGVPTVLFEGIPGPETTNADHFSSAGAAVRTPGPGEAAEAAIDLLKKKERLATMRRAIRELAKPDAATRIVDLAEAAIHREAPRDNIQTTLILTISNGYGHVRLGDSIADAIRKTGEKARVIDVADHMHPVVRFTHLTAYLWLVKHVPKIWDYIDRFQKDRSSTSPDWFYRYGLRRLFDFVRRTSPAAMIATEVGCCEIAALIKRDLGLTIPLIALNGELDSDRAWVKPEVDVFSCVDQESARALAQNGAAKGRIEVVGPIIAADFRPLTGTGRNMLSDRKVILVSGGSEAIGPIDDVVSMLLSLEGEWPAPQIVVLTGRDHKLRSECEKLARKHGKDRLEIRGWIAPQSMPEVLRRADLMISKLGNMFYEAVASGLPIIALEPPPGAEREQYRLLRDWEVGIPVATIADMKTAVLDLLDSPERLAFMTANTRGRVSSDAAGRIVDRARAARRSPSSTIFEETNYADKGSSSHAVPSH